MPEVGQSTPDTFVTPVSVFLGHTQDKSFDLSVRSWSARLTMSTPVVFISDQLSMPCKQRLRRDDVRDLCQSIRLNSFARTASRRR